MPRTATLRRTMRALVAFMACGALACLAAAARAGPQPAPKKLPDLGPNASLHGKRVFPSEDLWNKAIDKEPVDPN